MKYVFGCPFMTSCMKIFNFRKRFHQKVTHSKISVSKTAIGTLKTFKIRLKKNLELKTHNNKSKTTFNFDPKTTPPNSHQNNKTNLINHPTT